MIYSKACSSHDIYFVYICKIAHLKFNKNYSHFQDVFYYGFICRGVAEAIQCTRHKHCEGVSYNIESSTIYTTLIDKNLLKLFAICPSCLSRYQHLHCFVQVHFKILVNMHQCKGRQPVIHHSRPNISFRLGILNDLSAVALATGMVNKTHNRRIENRIYRIKCDIKCCWQIITFCNYPVVQVR